MLTLRLLFPVINFYVLYRMRRNVLATLLLFYETLTKFMWLSGIGKRAIRKSIQQILLEVAC